jgi:hypothetical protein
MAINADNFRYSKTPGALWLPASFNRRLLDDCSSLFINAVQATDDVRVRAKISSAF